MHLEKYWVVDGVSLAFGVGEESITLSSQKQNDLSVQSTHCKHNNKVNMHANNHLNKRIKHTKQQTQKKGFKHNNSTCEKTQ